MPGQLVGPAGLDDARVGDHERPLGADPAGRQSRLRPAPGTEHDLWGLELNAAVRILGPLQQADRPKPIRSIRTGDC
jgi:hypothetical protein